jgi:hypothetical protein
MEMDTKTAQQCLHLVEKAIGEINNSAHLERWLKNPVLRDKLGPKDSAYTEAVRMLESKREAILQQMSQMVEEK